MLDWSWPPRRQEGGGAGCPGSPRGRRSHIFKLLINLPSGHTLYLVQLKSSSSSARGGLSGHTMKYCILVAFHSLETEPAWPESEPYCQAAMLPIGAKSSDPRFLELGSPLSIEKGPRLFDKFPFDASWDILKIRILKLSPLAVSMHVRGAAPHPQCCPTTAPASHTTAPVQLHQSPKVQPHRRFSVALSQSGHSPSIAPSRPHYGPTPAPV